MKHQDLDLHESPRDVEPSEADTSTDSAVLNAAADLLMAKGWCRRAFAVDRHGFALSEEHLHDGVRFCAIGAIRYVTRETFSSAEERLDTAVADDCGGIGEWNDRPGRRRKDVVAKLREVAALAAAAEAVTVAQSSGEDVKP